MTMPKGFKPKVNRKEKREEDTKGLAGKKDNSIDSNDIKVATATTDDLTIKHENKLVTENISLKEDVTPGDLSIDEDAAIITTASDTTSEVEVQPENQSKVPSQEKEKVISSSPSSSPAETAGQFVASSLSIEDNHPEYKQKEEEPEQIMVSDTGLYQTKNNIRKATDEARKDIPRYTQAVNEYQEQTIQAAREIADNFLESQKEVINSFQSAWIPQIEAANRIFATSWVSPRHLADNYVRVESTLADSTIAATKLTNNIMLANIEAFKTSMQQAKDNVKELSRIGVNIARTFEQTSRYRSKTAGHDIHSSATIDEVREE
jgi:hypothetical protein